MTQIFPHENVHNYKKLPQINFIVLHKEMFSRYITHQAWIFCFLVAVSRGINGGNYLIQIVCIIEQDFWIIDADVHIHP